MRFLGWAALTICQASELESALESFASYQFGDSKKVLHHARLASYQGTDDAQRRLQNEQLLQDFIQSDASLSARRQACLWLSDLATESSRSLLTELMDQEGFEDVAQIARDALDAKQAEVAAVTSASGLFQAKVLPA